MNAVRLVECTDIDCCYGFLLFENATVEDMQNKIYEIKDDFYERDFNSWTIDDVINELPSEWNVQYIRDSQFVEI